MLDDLPFWFLFALVIYQSWDHGRQHKAHMKMHERHLEWMRHRIAVHHAESKGGSDATE